jgi:hypothetical protein
MSFLPLQLMLADSTEYQIPNVSYITFTDFLSTNCQDSIGLSIRCNLLHLWKSIASLTCRCVRFEHATFVIFCLLKRALRVETAPVDVLSLRGFSRIHLSLFS